MNSNITTRSSTKIVKKLFKDKEIIVTEIGVLGGKNTFDMLCELNISEFYAIDPYVVFDDISSQISQKYNKLNSAKERAIIRLKGFKNVNHIYKNSSDAIDEVPISDFIYIDGNHNYKFVKQDLNNYFNKVKIGGVFAGHDINKKEGVTKAVLNL